MRRARWLILLVIFGLIASVAAIFYQQRLARKSEAPVTPTPLSSNLNASAQNWSYTQMDGDRPVVSISARNFEQVKDPAIFNLEGVELKIFRKDAKEVDLVRSSKVIFDRNAGTLFSEGDVEITMGVPADAKPAGRLLVIRSSGVRFDAKSGKAETERAASFSFDLGEGQAVGATYDPATRELLLRSRVQLLWKSKGPKGRDMKLEAGELTYKERESMVYLAPWAKLTRGGLTMDAGPSLVHLNEGYIRDVEAQAARGIDKEQGRQLEYAAADLRMDFDDDGIVQKITGTRDARLISTSAVAQTTVTSDRLDLFFHTDSGESRLHQAQASGKAFAESKPAPRQNVPIAETRTLRSEFLELEMRAGGEEIDTLKTHAPGHIEFLPNRPGQRRRVMDAERMTMQYGERNQLKSYTAANVATKTFREVKKKGDPEFAQTWSKSLTAAFDPKTGQLTTLEQGQEFRYEEGARKAKADHAVLEQASEQITLDGGARVWDPAGSTAGNHIVLDQKTNDFVAEGNVTSTRLPDKKGKSATMLSQEEAMQAKASRMYSTDRQSVIHYEGNAVLWQGANRLHADSVTIDRGNEVLTAKGKVFSQFVDEPKAQKGKPAPKQKPAPVYTTVRAQELVYTGKEKLAHYKGGATLTRPNMDVKAQEIKAWLKEEEDGGTSLDHAFAFGKADILQRSPGRTRHGTGERAEYYIGDGKVTLEGGDPQLVDSLRGSTKGRKLTWFAEDDRLLVDGAERAPVRSLIRRNN